MFTIVDSHDTVFNDYALTRKGNDAFDDILVGDIVWCGTGHGVFDAFTFVFFDFFAIFVHKDDDLPTLGYVFLPHEMSPGDSGAIDYYAIVVLEGVFHAGAHYVVRPVNISI